MKMHRISVNIENPFFVSFIRMFLCMIFFLYLDEIFWWFQKSTSWITIFVIFLCSRVFSIQDSPQLRTGNKASFIKQLAQMLISLVKFFSAFSFDFLLTPFVLTSNKVCNFHYEKWKQMMLLINKAVQLKCFSNLCMMVKLVS